MSVFMHEFIKTVMSLNAGDVVENVTLSTLLQSILNNSCVRSTPYTNLRIGNVKGILEISNYHIQICNKRDKNGNSDNYELIIADNSDGKKRMAVLTAESVDSELVEMDCSGVRENVIIDLNREGRRWEGGELNGKPFGFGYEYSEDDNLVYEGFVFEGKKVCFGKEWNDDGNNNCLVYEGGYCNGERCGKGKSYDLDGNVDFEGEWMNNRVMTENEKIIVKDDLIVSMWIEEFVVRRSTSRDSVFSRKGKSNSGRIEKTSSRRRSEEHTSELQSLG